MYALEQLDAFVRLLELLRAVLACPEPYQTVNHAGCGLYRFLVAAFVRPWWVRLGLAEAGSRAMLMGVAMECRRVRSSDWAKGVAMRGAGVGDGDGSMNDGGGVAVELWSP